MAEETPESAATTVKASDTTDKKIKGGGKWAKYKWYIIGGGIFVILLIFYFLHKSSGSATAASSTTDIDPQTGYPYGSAQDLAALGASGTQTGVPGQGGGGWGGGGGGGSGTTGTTTPTPTPPLGGYNWQTITTNGQMTAAQYETKVGTASWADLLQKDPWLVNWEGKKIPKGYKLDLGYGTGSGNG